MGKLTTYTLIMTGLVLLFYFAGLIQNSPNTTLLNLLLNPEGMKTSNLNIQNLLLFEGIVAAGIIAIASKIGNIELALKGALTLFLFNLLWDFILVFNVAASTNIVLALLVFAPLIFLYFPTIVEWWSKHD